jgi:hypothetical protein
MPYTEPIDEIALHEILWQVFGERLVEAQAKYLVNPGASKPFHFFTPTEQSRRCFLGAKKFRRVWFEGHYGCGHSQLPGLCLQRRYQL